MSQWYYAHGGQQKGPVPLSELQRLAANGEFDSENDLVWKEGMDDWKPASTVDEVAAAFAPPPAEAPSFEAAPEGAPPAPAPAPAASPAPSSLGAPAEPPYGTTSQAPAPSGVPSSGMAVASMVCGILSLVTCCLWFVGLPLAIVAIVLGHLSVSRAKADPAAYGGRGQARAGLITGYIAIPLALVGLAFGLWAATLTPEKVRAIDWLTPEQKEEIIRELEKQPQFQQGDEE